MKSPPQLRTHASSPVSQLRLGFELEHSADFESFSSFGETFAGIFAEAFSKEERAGAIRLGWIETPIGPLIAASRKAALILLEFTNRQRMQEQAAMLKKRFDEGFVAEDDDVIKRTRRELKEYFAGKRTEFTVPLDFPGTPFEGKVWNELLKIPFGATRSYEHLAMTISSKGAVRAVGSANGRNRISILIPCHRVVNKSGALGGYGGGLWRKQALLALEQGRPIQS